jgi:Sulfatase-modifying factor enzyme 1
LTSVEANFQILGRSGGVRRRPGERPIHTIEVRGGRVAPVDAFPPSGFGLYNVTGNVWEWCAEWFETGY